MAEGLFEEFQNQGEALMQFREPKMLMKDEAFWEKERVYDEAAKDVIQKFKGLHPHDMFQIQPSSYNLSIQHEEDDPNANKPQETVKEQRQKLKDEKQRQLLDKQLNQKKQPSDAIELAPL